LFNFFIYLFYEVDSFEYKKCNFFISQNISYLLFSVFLRRGCECKMFESPRERDSK